MRLDNSTYHQKRFDWWCILIYVLLVLLGLLSINSASLEDAAQSVFSSKFGVQLIWIALSFSAGGIILLSSKEFYYKYAFVMYIAMCAVLLLVIFLGKEVNGARSWIGIGGFGVQPSEFGKVITALMLARYMSDYDYSIKKKDMRIKTFLIIGIPMLIILAQNDTGSAVVFLGFGLVLYANGLNKWYFIVFLSAAILFLASFLLVPEFLLLLLLVIVAAVETANNGNPKAKIIYIASVLLIYLLLMAINLWKEWGIDSEHISLLALALSLPLIVVYFLEVRKRLSVYLLYLVSAIAYLQTVDFIFDNVLQIHQQKRILDLLGLESDFRGWGYNVNQSKIAIGSGGFWGKGYLNGTQTKYSFVPEQSTDFIFCTIGEEKGFIGTLIVIGLFALLLFRLMKMANSVNDNFARIYTFGVVSILFTHIVINIGMTIGLVPVIGIPLPFFSYGGSSLLAFTTAVFIAIRLCAQSNRY